MVTTDAEMQKLDLHNVLKQALSLDSARDGEYRGDIERALGDKTSGAKRSAWLARARASYESSEVLFRVNQLDGR